MLKLINFSKSRLNYICKHISTSSVRLQNEELVKYHVRDDALRVVEKKPQRPPLVKNFFVGSIDTELLAYPEVIYENEQLETAKQRKKTYDDFLETNIFSNPDDVNNINKLKEFGCFKSPSPLVTEAMYSVSESDAKYLSYGTFLNNHQLVLKLINEFGESSQKLKYLPMLESGDSIATPCLFEAKLRKQSKKLFDVEAKFNDTTEKWILNGEKNYVLISPAHKNSTTFLVIGSAEKVDHIGNPEDSLVALIVDAALPGVSISEVDQTIGFGEKTFNQVTVSFKDVTLDKSNVLGEGIAVAEKLLNMLRLDKGVQALAGIMKPVLNHLVNDCINTKIQGISLKDIDAIKEQLGALTSNYYALESMIYMTAGLTDIYEKQDIDIETAMVQAFSISTLTDFIITPLHAVGPRAVIQGFGYDRFIRDAVQLAASGEQMDAIKQFIGLAGLNFAGQTLNESVKKGRNPLDNPAFIFSRMFFETSIEKPKKKFHLERFLHQSLDPAASFLEFSILRLSAASEIVLSRHGALVVQHSVEVAKLAEAATLCYAMFASAARASRSYCIGLRNADQEVNLANYFCFYGAESVKVLAKEIDTGEYGTSEHTFKTVGERLFAAKQYHLEHPTARNF